MLQSGEVGEKILHELIHRHLHIHKLFVILTGALGEGGLLGAHQEVDGVLVIDHEIVGTFGIYQDAVCDAGRLGGVLIAHKLIVLIDGTNKVEGFLLLTVL